MTERGDVEAVFDPALLARVADQYDVAEERLVAAVDDHQSSVAALPGIENLVYEWRKQFQAPVVERTPDVYYLAAPGWVWSEFRDHLDVDDATLDALVELHRQTVVRGADVAPEPPDGEVYVVLDRRRDGR